MHLYSRFMEKQEININNQHNNTIRDEILAKKKAKFRDFALLDRMTLEQYRATKNIPNTE